MKRILVFVAALFLMSGWAWAEGGGCKLPDLAGLSPDQRAVAALAAGFQISRATESTPACPVAFNCNNLRQCAPSAACAYGSIGPCCDAGGGDVICCANNGNIWVLQCFCECTGPNCSPLCENSTHVEWSCG